MFIRQGEPADFSHILALINEAAQAYRGIIPNDRWHEPYMPADELSREIANGVDFWVAEDDEGILGVMAIQDRDDVTLVRHAYVAPSQQRKGVGLTLLRHIEALGTKPILIGTWADAWWAIDFYRRNGFTLVPSNETGRLLRTYWSIPERQVETSVVLANRQWIDRLHGTSRLDSLRQLAASFRTGIEQARAGKVPGALPYFPDGACRLTSRLFALHLTRRTDSTTFGPARLVSGVLPGSEFGARHYWLEVDDTIVDLTADAFGEPAVLVGASTAFHDTLTAHVNELAADNIASLSTDDMSRLVRQLAAIEQCMTASDTPSA